VTSSEVRVRGESSTGEMDCAEALPGAQKEWCVELRSLVLMTHHSVGVSTHMREVQRLYKTV
jgi:hypothetical protein